MKQILISQHRQKGIAAILILVTLGLALTATMLGSAHYLRTSQEQHMVLHAQTIAEARVWTAAEALRGYLEEVAKDESEWERLVAGDSFSMDGFGGAVEASIINITELESASHQQLTVRLIASSAQNTRAESATVLEVVYDITLATAGGGGGNGESIPVYTFSRALKLGGSIQVESEEGKDYQMHVRGTLDTDGNSITGVSVIRVTESIEIGSGSSFDELHANGDIKLDGSVSGRNNLSARGNICLSGGASAEGQVRANGTVIGDGSVQFGDISSIGRSDYEGLGLCGTLALDNNGQPFGVDLRGNSSAKSVKSKASVRVNSGSVQALQSEGDLADTNWGGSINGEIGGQLRATHTNPDLQKSVKTVPDLVVPVEPVPLIEIDIVNFNAYDLRQDANYAFWMDTSGYKMVAVKDVNGMEDGDYYLGKSDADSKEDQLCISRTSISQRPTCASPSFPLCKGKNERGCFTYDSNIKKWTIANSDGMAQGVLWFEGSLEFTNSGRYYGTFIATGNIKTGGDYETTAPNYAGYARRNGLSHGMCSDLVFPGHYPTQFCQSGNYNYAAAGWLGNYALMAGSCDSDHSLGCRYQGGNIQTGRSSVIRGAIKAGNEFVSGGSSTIHGYVTALALGAEHENSSMGGSTRIVLTNLPDGYDPTGGGGGGDTPLDASAVLRWGRYL